MNTAVLNSIQSLQDTADTLVLPAHFPQQEYMPFGYIDNPSHSTVLNRSGIIRSVPPMGFGFWCRSLPWPYSVKRHSTVLSTARPVLAEQLEDDEAFYRPAPLLTGDWPDRWKHGWIYDYETLRMTVRPPAGIFKHAWDGMQIFMPRSVLGEAHLKAFLEWWFTYRTDDEGWFHCNNSWESGQDGSKRFTFDGCDEGDVVDFVRTVDVEAAMANALENMVLDLCLCNGNAHQIRPQRPCAVGESV